MSAFAHLVLHPHVLTVQRVNRRAIIRPCPQVAGGKLPSLHMRLIYMIDPPEGSEARDRHGGGISNDIVRTDNVVPGETPAVRDRQQRTGRRTDGIKSIAC